MLDRRRFLVLAGTALALPKVALAKGGPMVVVKSRGQTHRIRLRSWSKEGIAQVTVTQGDRERYFTLRTDPSRMKAVAEAAKAGGALEVRAGDQVWRGKMSGGLRLEGPNGGSVESDDVKASVTITLSVFGVALSVGTDGSSVWLGDKSAEVESTETEGPVGGEGTDPDGDNDEGQGGSTGDEE